MKANNHLLRSILFGTALVVFGHTAGAAVSVEEAAKLRSELTPFGAERAGNKEGTIPVWNGGYTQAIPGFENGGRRPDPFKDEKPLFVIDVTNMDQYADRLSEGLKAMLKKYPATFKINVYPSYRTAAAPQWVYDNTFKNATRATLGERYMRQNAHGGIPFPIPKNGAEAIWNHIMRWRGTSWHVDVRGVLTTADGRHVPTVFASGDFQMPYYFKESSPEEFKEKHNNTNWTVLIGISSASRRCTSPTMPTASFNVHPKRY